MSQVTKIVRELTLKKDKILKSGTNEIKLTPLSEATIHFLHSLEIDNYNEAIRDFNSGVPEWHMLIKSDVSFKALKKELTTLNYSVDFMDGCVYVFF